MYLGLLGPARGQARLRRRGDSPPARGPRLAARARGPGSGPPIRCFDPAACGVRVARLGPPRRPQTAGPSRDLYRGGGERDGGRALSLLLRIPGRVRSLRSSSCPPRRAASARLGWARSDAANCRRDLH
jgi:hypothetical protein